jgi:hypothetical protein
MSKKIMKITQNGVNFVFSKSDQVSPENFNVKIDNDGEIQIEGDSADVYFHPEVWKYLVECVEQLQGFRETGN